MGYERDGISPSLPAGSPARRIRWIATRSTPPQRGARSWHLRHDPALHGAGADLQLHQLRFASMGQQGSINAGAINFTALSTRLKVYICPSDSGQVPPLNKLLDPTNGITFNAYSQCSYAGVVGTVDIFRWSCGCPASSNDGLVCFGNSVELMPNGAYGYNHVFSLVRFMTD